MRAFGDSAGAHLALLLGTNTDEPGFDGGFAVTHGRVDVDRVVAWYPPTRLDTMQAESLPGTPFMHDTPDAPESILLGGPVPERTEQALSLIHI